MGFWFETHGGVRGPIVQGDTRTSSIRPSRYHRHTCKSREQHFSIHIIPLHHSSCEHISRVEILEPAVGAPNARGINVQQMWSRFLPGIELLIPRCFWQVQHQTRKGKRGFVTYYVISLMLAYLNLPRCRVVVSPCGRIRREFDQVFGTDGRKISSCRTKSTREQMA